MPANLIVAVVLLATEWFRYHRAKDKSSSADHHDPHHCHEC